MPYTRATWIDEILAGDPRYDILENGGGAFKATMQINLATSVTQAGSALEAVKMNNIEGELQILSDLLLYKLAVSVASNDLVVTLQHSDGTNPTSTRPLYFRIGGVWRAVTTTTTITVVDGSSWFGAGAAHLGTQLCGYFPYVVWDSNSSVVALSIARIPYGRLVSDFNSSATSEKHLIGYVNFTSTDPVANIGYFEATLSLAGTSHLWTVPTFTNVNLRHEPTFQTQRLIWAPAPTGYSAVPTSNMYQYMIDRNLLYGWISEGADGTSNATTLTITLPFSVLTLTAASWNGMGNARDNTAALTTAIRINLTSAATTAGIFPNQSGTSAWTASGGKRITAANFVYPIG